MVELVEQEGSVHSSVRTCSSFRAPTMEVLLAASFPRAHLQEDWRLSFPNYYLLASPKEQALRGVLLVVGEVLLRVLRHYQGHQIVVDLLQILVFD